jgi:hypothetical protein
MRARAINPNNDAVCVQDINAMRALLRTVHNGASARAIHTSSGAVRAQSIKGVASAGHEC